MPSIGSRVIDDVRPLLSLQMLERMTVGLNATYTSAQKAGSAVLDQQEGTAMAESREDGHAISNSQEFADAKDGSSRNHGSHSRTSPDSPTEGRGSAAASPAESPVILTQPSDGVGNGGMDNVNSDLILSTGLVLESAESGRR